MMVNAPYAHFVIDDNAALFEEPMCEERVEAYKAAASVMFLHGCFDDGAFLMALAGLPKTDPPILQELL